MKQGQCGWDLNVDVQSFSKIRKKKQKKHLAYDCFQFIFDY